MVDQRFPVFFAQWSEAQQQPVVHSAILNAVHDLLLETSVRDLTMEAVAKRAGVGKPTLYKWWPSKAALVFSMFHERLAREGRVPEPTTVEALLRARMKHLVSAFSGLFGKVMAELIAEGQSDPVVLRELVHRTEDRIDQQFRVDAGRELAACHAALDIGDGRCAPRADVTVILT